jgi:cupin fold WbuC family metalloprotein
MNYNFHQAEDCLQRFLNAIEPESYIRPHRHINPEREEIFLLIGMPNPNPDPPVLSWQF